ncbi:MAG: elongation factor Ts [Candidatus Omnitrophica bacterium]|nr:elongation factor Ts [Candidatus Omnitrophota bacterium]
MKESIKKLRDLTGFGIGDCKKALEESKNDVDKALSILREKGAQILEKRAEKKASQGLIEAYIHFSQSLGTIVEVNCESDFVARNEDFKSFAKNLAMHIAALSPKYISREEVCRDDIEGLPEKEKEDFFRKNCLLEQGYVKDDSMTISDYLKSLVAKFKENIVIRRFVRFSLGQE